MKLLLLRHAVAEDRATFAASGKEDRLRPLTEDGAGRCARSAMPSPGSCGPRPDRDQSLRPDARLSGDSRSRLPRAAGGFGARRARARRLAGGLSSSCRHRSRCRSSPALVTSRTSRSSPAGCSRVGRSPSSNCEGRRLPLDFAGRVAPGNATLLWHLTPPELRSLRYEIPADLLARPAEEAVRRLALV